MRRPRCLTGARNDDSSRRKNAAARCRTRLLIAALVMLLTGCGADGPHSTPRVSTSSNASSGTSSVTGAAAHVVATIEVANPVTLLATPHWVWVLGGPSGVMTKVDPSTNQVVQEVHPPHPAGYGTYAFGSLWVVSFMENALMQVDPESGQVLQTIVGSAGMPLDGPVGVAATGHDLWILNHNSPTLLRLDPITAALEGTTRLPGSKASGPLLAGGWLWLAMTRNGVLIRVDPRTGRITGEPIRVPAGLCLAGIVAGGELWFTSIEVQGFACRDGVSRVEAASGTVTEVPGLADRRLAGFAEAAGMLWADDTGHDLLRVDPGAGTVEQVLTFDGSEDAGQLIAAFGSLWAARVANGQLVRIDVG